MFCQLWSNKREVETKGKRDGGRERIEGKKGEREKKKEGEGIEGKGKRGEGEAGRAGEENIRSYIMFWETATKPLLLIHNC